MPELIDRQSALSVCKEYCWLDDEDFIEGYNTAIKDIREAIKELPTIEPEVRHGRMIEGRYPNDNKCSECG
jgi:pimeloyl-CoA synthetase